MCMLWETLQLSVDVQVPHLKSLCRTSPALRCPDCSLFSECALYPLCPPCLGSCCLLGSFPPLCKPQPSILRDSAHVQNRSLSQSLLPPLLSLLHATDRSIHSFQILSALLVLLCGFVKWLLGQVGVSSPIGLQVSGELTHPNNLQSVTDHRCSLNIH